MSIVDEGVKSTVHQGNALPVRLPGQNIVEVVGLAEVFDCQNSLVSQGL